MLLTKQLILNRLINTNNSYMRMTLNNHDSNNIRGGGRGGIQSGTKSYIVMYK